MRVATFILNRNLGHATDDLCKAIEVDPLIENDIFVIDCSTDPRKRSERAYWVVDDPEVIREGLRFGLGMNYGLAALYEKNVLTDYDVFCFCTNDLEVSSQTFISDMVDLFSVNKELAILAPIESGSSENELFSDSNLKFTWTLQSPCLFVTRKFVETIMNPSRRGYYQFLFDGDCKRGFYHQQELVAKAYANGFAAGITNLHMIVENKSLLDAYFLEIETDPHDINYRKYLAEGRAWLRAKYGYDNTWGLIEVSRFWYDKFFERYPHYREFRI